MLCTQLLDLDEIVSNTALECLKKEVKGSTTSMTSVPKPFKFLKLHYPNIITHYEKLQISDYKRSLADFLSVLSMTMAEPNQQTSLKLLIEGTLKDYMNWGHEYMHHIAGDIGVEYGKRIENQQPFEDLLDLVKQIIPHFIQSSAEADAIDLLLEVDRLEDLIQFINKDNFQRVFIYLTSSSLYSADTDEMIKTLKTTYDISLKQQQFSNALTLGLKLDDLDLIKKVFENCEDK